jgi:hypothetical protein
MLGIRGRELARGMTCFLSGRSCTPAPDNYAEFAVITLAQTGQFTLGCLSACAWRCLICVRHTAFIV